MVKMHAADWLTFLIALPGMTFMGMLLGQPLGALLGGFVIFVCVVVAQFTIAKPLEALQATNLHDSSGQPPS